MSNTKRQSIITIGIIYTASNLVLRGIAFLTTPIFTRLMSQAEFGDFSNIASWANVLSVLITLSLHSSINRAKYDYDSEMASYLSSICILGTLVTVACWGGVELNINYFEVFLSMDRVYIRSLMLFCMFSPSVQILMAKHRMYNEYKSVVILTWSTLLVSTISSVVFVIILPDKLFGRVLGNYICVAIIDFALWLYVIVKGKRFNVLHCKYALQLSVPLIPHELAGILLTLSDRIIIKQLCGGEDAALYTLAYTISTIIVVFLSSINQAWVPWFYDHISIGDYSPIKKATKLYAVVFTIICIGLMLIGPELVLIFGGNMYMPAEFVIPPVCLSAALQFVYTLYVNVEFYKKRSFLISIATVMASITNILLNYLLIPKYGYIAAAYTTVAGYTMMVIFHYIASRKISDCHKYFDIRMLLAIIGVNVLGMFVALLLYNYNIIRYIVLATYIAAAFAVVFRYRAVLVGLVRGKKEF